MHNARIIPSKPALVLEGQEKSVIITDIHIGFESYFSSNEVFIGKNSSINETITEISEIIDSEKPDSVILLGDVKSSIKNISKNEWDEVPLFFEKIKEKCRIILIPGNHDANIHRLVPQDVSMIGTIGMVEENILLTHGHAMPPESFSHVDRIIMGHVHPVFFQDESILNGQRVWISLKTQKQNIFPNRTGEIEITVVPSFNRYFYATHRIKHKKSISPIIEKIKNVASAKIITLEGAIIGNESMIDQVL
jgi:putative SbcD/Mre11-related phosphoesterase